MGSRSRPSARRARASQQAGRRFELNCLKAFAVAGISANDTDEINGFVKGVDIWLPDLGIAVQCKATKTKKSLYQGLREAERGAPSAEGWACIHSHRADGKAPKIRVAFRYSGGCGPITMPLAAFLTWCNEVLQETKER